MLTYTHKTIQYRWYRFTITAYNRQHTYSAHKTSEITEFMCNAALYEHRDPQVMCTVLGQERTDSALLRLGAGHTAKIPL